MQRFKRILVYINPDRGPAPAIKRAAALARQNDSKITLMAVVDDPPWYLKLVTRGSLQPPELIESEVTAALAELAVPLKREGLDVTTRVEVGTAFFSLVQAVVDEGYDLLVKTAEGGGRLRSALFGTTAMHLMRKAPCPVWVVDPREQERYRRILVAVDPNPQRAESLLLTRKLLELSTSMAERQAAELHLLHVWRVPHEGTLRRHGSAADVAEVLEESRKRAEEAVWQAVAPFHERFPQGHTHVRRGEPEWLINEAAEELGIDLLVMGTVGRTGVSGLLIGNVAEQVISQAQCSVLAVKPDGFVSPILPSNAGAAQ